MKGLHKTLVKQDNIVLREIERENFLFPVSRFGDYNKMLFSLNKVARCIWDLIDGRRTCGEIAGAVEEEYEVGQKVIQNDVERFISLLLNKRLISFKEK